MKNIEDLSASEFKKLQMAGLIWVIYPNTPKNYMHKDKSLAFPKHPEDIDWTPVIKLAKDHIDDIAQGKDADEDNKQWFYETVMTTVYGATIFNWINKNSH